MRFPLFVCAQKVTHVVARLDASGRAPRTIKYMCALLTGQWVVSAAWADACLSASAPVPEGPHEACGDDKGAPRGTPAACRARAAAPPSRRAPPLLHELKIHLAGEFASPSRADLETLILAGGGRVLKWAPSPPSPGKALDPGLRVICEGSSLAAPGGAVGAPRGGRTSAVAAAMCATGAPALGHTWLLDSVASGALLPTEKYQLRA
jgi:hypothetical protein